MPESQNIRCVDICHIYNDLSHLADIFNSPLRTFPCTPVCQLTVESPSPYSRYFGIGHFRVALNLIVKARLSAQFLL